MLRLLVINLVAAVVFSVQPAVTHPAEEPPPTQRAVTLSADARALAALRSTSASLEPTTQPAAPVEQAVSAEATDEQQVQSATATTVSTDSQVYVEPAQTAVTAQPASASNPVSASDTNTKVSPTKPSATATHNQKTKQPTEPAPKAETATITLAITIQTPAGSSTSSVTTAQGSTVLTAMQSGNINLTVKQFSGMGAYVTAINGLAEDLKGGMIWAYSVNGQKATVGISAYTLRDGDQILWSYEPIH